MGATTSGMHAPSSCVSLTARARHPLMLDTDRAVRPMALDEEIIRTIELAGASFVDLTSSLVADLTTWRRDDPLAVVALNSES